MAAIYFSITPEGFTASLDAANTGLNLQLTHVSGHNAAGVEIGRWPLSGGIVEPNSNTLRFSSVMTSTSRKELYGLKLLGDSLVFATSAGASPLVVVDANIDFVPAFGLALGQIPVGSITVSTDPNAPLAIILMLQHVGAANPHPQYTMKAVFDNHVGQNTLEHNNLLAMIQAVNQRVANLEIREEVQIGEFIITDDPRNPVLYKGYGEWRLVPNVMLSGLDLGGVTGQVRQIALGVGQNVRTTFFWRRIDPNAIQPTRTITIAEDAFELSLRDLFEAQYGEPVIGEQVNFVIADGVLVTAYNTSNYAIVTGDWPPQTGLFMDNYGIVAGRGGRGGTGIGETTPPEAKHGFDGGSAILATYPLALNNLNTVAGGGAGGGASANWRATAGTASAHIGNVGGSGGAPYGEAGDLGIVNDGIIDWGAGLPGIVGDRTAGGAAVTRTETRIGSTLNHVGGSGGGLGQNGGMGSGSGSRTGGDFYPNEWRAGGTGGLAGIAITGPVAVTGNPVLGR